MIVIAAKVSVRKILACVLAAGTMLTGAAVLLAGGRAAGGGSFGEYAPGRQTAHE